MSDKWMIIVTKAEQEDTSGGGCRCNPYPLPRYENVSSFEGLKFLDTKEDACNEYVKMTEKIEEGYTVTVVCPKGEEADSMSYVSEYSDYWCDHCDGKDPSKSRERPKHQMCKYCEEASTCDDRYLG